MGKTCPRCRAALRPRLGYDPLTLARFLALAVPLLVLAMALFAFAVDSFGPAAAQPVAGRLVLATWLIESLGLTGLFLLLEGRTGSPWLDGVATGWIAWLFRGPVLVLTVATVAAQGRDPWWPLALRWWFLYSLCGLLLAGLARGLKR